MKSEIEKIFEREDGSRVKTVSSWKLTTNTRYLRVGQMKRTTFGLCVLSATGVKELNYFNKNNY